MTQTAKEILAKGQWSHVLTAEEIEVFHVLTESLDPAFAARERKWFATQTAARLQSDMRSAWYANIPGEYQMNRSYLKLRFGIDAR